MPTGGQRLGSQLGALLFGAPDDGSAWLKGQIGGAQAQSALETARKARADAIIREAQGSARTQFDPTALIDPNATLEQRAAALKYAALGDLGGNVNSSLDAYKTGRSQSRIDAADEAFRSGNTSLGNLLLAASEGKPLDTTTVSDGTAYNKYGTPDQGMQTTAVGLGDILAKQASAANSYASAAKSRSEMGSGGGVVGGGKAADWSIQQGADGQLYRVNKINGSALPVVTQGLPADGQPVIGANSYKATALGQKNGTAQASLMESEAGLDRLGDAAMTLANMPGVEGITGMTGYFPNIPGSKASDAQAQLDTLKSQTAFSVLQQMRNMSKTGGALGSVSDKEGELLQSNLAALSSAQSPEQFKKNLQAIVHYTEEAKKRLRNGFSATYGGGGLGNMGAPPPATTPTIPAGWTVTVRP